MNRVAHSLLLLRKCLVLDFYLCVCNRDDKVDKIVFLVQYCNTNGSFGTIFKIFNSATTQIVNWTNNLKNNINCNLIIY